MEREPSLRFYVESLRAFSSAGRSRSLFREPLQPLTRNKSEPRRRAKRGGRRSRWSFVAAVVDSRPAMSVLSLPLFLPALPRAASSGGGVRARACVRKLSLGASAAAAVKDAAALPPLAHSRERRESKFVEQRNRRSGQRTAFRTCHSHSLFLPLSLARFRSSLFLFSLLLSRRRERQTERLSRGIVASVRAAAREREAKQKKLLPSETTTTTTASLPFSSVQDVDIDIALPRRR